MLSPEYLWSIADSVVNIYDEMNSWAIKDIVERIMAAELYEYDGLPGTARYRAWLLNQAGEHYDNMAKKAAEITKKSEAEIMKLFIDAGLTAIENDFEPFGKTLYDIRKDKRAAQILQSAYERTNGELRNYTRTTLDQNNKLMINTLDKAYFEVSAGMKSYSEVIRESIDTVSKTGCEVEYPRSGHIDSIEVAVRRAVMTGINQGAANITLHNCEVLGTDYVIVDSHVGARYNENDKIANHMGWQGGVYKIHGTGTYSNEKKGVINAIKRFLNKIGFKLKGDFIPNLEEETGFPSNPLGLCGYNCKHSFYVFIPEIDNPDMYKHVVIDEEASKKQYDLCQKQRRMERNIRKSKQMLLGYQTAIDNCKNEHAKFELQLEYDKRAYKLRKQNKAYNEFCKENDLRKENERIKVAKWNREQSYQATRGANQYKSADLKEHKVHNIKSNAPNTVNTRVVNSKKYTDKFEGIGKNKSVDNTVKNKAIDILNERNGTNKETVSYMDYNTGKELLYNNQTDQEYGIKLTDVEKSAIIKYEGELIALHNHPQSTRPSLGDLITMQNQRNVIKIIVAGHNGKVYIISNIDRSADLLEMYDREVKFYRQSGCDMALAQKKAIDAIYEKGVFDYEER